MKFIQIARTFRDDENGAVTVDWVVLTAAIVGLGIAVLTTITQGAQTITETISSHRADPEIGAAFTSAE